ncbi:hypothetical protein Nepgr_005150 [Nepenthes gracilis]|uniref:SPARK domain-containing protein n=1 Tax=Nepenthes gracilis TaxID=150966 RepID=A0AAD3S2T1_NEPGR|nr:hypothetical protein Nepgr_005150 [Nepenthes gracilis]
MQPLITLVGCPLNSSRSNVTLVASVCSNHDDHGKCCRYINAFVAVSIGHYANATSNLGVDLDVSEVCFHSILGTLELYGVPPNATGLCGFWSKITVNYVCKGRRTVTQMLQSPGFANVADNCEVPLLEESDCKGV